MSHYDDEAEVAALKKWWHENWMALVAGLVVGLGAIFGWQGWQRYQDSQAQQASQIFEDMKQAYATSKAEDAQRMGETLLADFAGTPYASAAAFRMAAVAVEGGDLAQAGSRLDWVIKNGADEGLRQLAQLRKARVLWALNQADDALRLLEGKAGVYAALYQELRGDIQLARGERAAAHAAYQKALEVAAEDDRAIRESLRRKLDDLTDVASAS
jgi:predicted negative regulator of RcsB-dependent stress response